MTFYDAMAMAHAYRIDLVLPHCLSELFLAKNTYLGVHNLGRPLIYRTSCFSPTRKRVVGSVKLYEDSIILLVGQLKTFQGLDFRATYN